MGMSFRLVDHFNLASWPTVGCWLVAPLPLYTIHLLNEYGII